MQQPLKLGIAGLGTVGAGLSTTHIYGSVGLFTVTLTVRDPIVSAMTTGTILVDPAGAIAHWRFDEGTGATAQDASGNNNDGNVDGANWVAGLRGSALEFDGVEDSLFHPHDLAGRRHMEYVRDRGVFDELPYDEIEATFRAHHAELFGLGDDDVVGGDFYAEAAAERDG